MAESGSSLRRSWERLGRAATGPALRDRKRRLATLGALLDELAQPDSPLREALARALEETSGFEPSTLRAGLALALGAWSRTALEKLVEEGLGTRRDRVAQSFPRTAVLQGGALPMPNLLSLLLPLAVGSPVLARSGRHDPTTAHFLAAALRERDPELGRCLEVVDFPIEDEEAMEAFLEAECVSVTGSDETLRAVARRLRPSQRLVGFGHRVSVAAWWLGREASRLWAAARNLAIDVALWDQLGCLSPVALYVHAEQDRVPAEVAEALARALDAAAHELPRGRLSPGARAQLAHERQSAELRAASDPRVRVLAGEDWTVVLEGDTRPRVAPLHRFLRVHPVRDAAELAKALRPLAPWLAAVGVAGAVEAGSPWLAGLVELAPGRICGQGRMQAPPLGWAHEGMDALAPFVRLTDLELYSPRGS